MPDRSTTPVAIIGIGCRLPGHVSDPQSLWELLVQGRNVWSPVPEDRYNEKAFLHPRPDNSGTTNHRGGHFLDRDISAFDAAFFGISPAEAKSMDPQQRMLLEVSYEAFENAGITIESLKGSDTAVFAAMFTRDYDRIIHKDSEDIPKYHTTGCGEAIISNRISYTFDLRGPSITLDTGCSGSLVGLHQACQSLRVGETELALACGVNIVMGPEHMIAMSNLHMLNENGRCYPFDIRGSGYGRGEGVTAVVVKRLNDAIRDRDNIRAVLLNTGINQDGRTNGITHPSQSAQAALQRALYKACGLNPADTKYIEAHGTGTVAGDIAELGAISEVFCKDRKAGDELYVGSIKSNIGHLESSSGLAALIKAILVLEKGAIPPNADHTRLKPALDSIGRRIRIPAKLEVIDVNRPPRASVNSFGYGGVNAHAILESLTLEKSTSEHPNELELKPCELSKKGNALILEAEGMSSSPCPNVEGEVKNPIYRLFILSANSPVSVIHAISKLRSWASLREASNLNLSNLAYHLAVVDQYYLIVILSSQARIKLPRTPIVYIFTGQGAQWYAMGRSLLFQFAKFRDSIDISSVILQNLGARWDLVKELLSSEARSRINESEIAQPATTALQIALVDLLASFGIQAQTVIGHSSGEIAAAYAAGVLNHTAALKVSYLRGVVSGLCKRNMSVAGAMISVGLDEQAINPFIDGTMKGTLTVACLNSPRNLTVSGDKAAIYELAGILNSKGISNRILNVDTAYHSHHMLHVANAYLEYLGTTETRSIKNSVRFISTVTATEKSSGFDSTYWVENLVSKVRFSDAIQSYLSQEPATHGREDSIQFFVEIGPHSALRGPVLQSLDDACDPEKHRYLPTLERNRDAATTVLELVAKLLAYGNHIDLHAVNGVADSKVRFELVGDLPPYAWDHSNTFWHESRQSQEFRFRQRPCHDLLGVKIPGSPAYEPRWRHIISLEDLPWLQDHVIETLPTFPGAAYLCMAIEAMRQVTPNDKLSPEHSTKFVLRDVRFVKALIIPPTPDKVEIQMSFQTQQSGGLWQEFRIYSVSSDRTWNEHCRGRIMATHITFSQDIQSVTQPLERLHKDGAVRYNAKEVYDRLTSRGNTYGPCFASIKHMYIAGDEAACELIVPNTKSIMPSAHQEPHLIHPATLDSIMHSALPLLSHNHASGAIMPVSIEELSISADAPNNAGSVINVNTKLLQKKARSASADITAFDPGADSHKSLLSIRGMNIVDVGTSSTLKLSLPDQRHIVHTLEWEEDIGSLNVPAGLGFRKEMSLQEYLRKLCLAFIY